MRGAVVYLTQGAWSYLKGNSFGSTYFISYAFNDKRYGEREQIINRKAKED